MSQVRTIRVDESEPGIVHVTTEALHELLTQAGWQLTVDSGHREYVLRYPEASDAHPDTMIGKQ